MTDIQEFITIEDLRRELGRVNKRLARERQDRIQLEEVITRAAKASFATLEPPAIVRPPRDRRKGVEVAVALTADWQLGKITPTYDSEVTERRIQEYGRRIIELTEIQRQEHPVNNLHLWVLGDIVEGERIFPGQEYLIDSALIDQVVTNGTRILRDLILTLLGSFKHIHIPAVIGNHGRVGGLKSNVFHPATNMDRMLYLVTKQYFDVLETTGALDKGRVTWDIPTHHKGDRGWYAIDTIGNYSSLLVHGDQFTGGGGVASLPYPRINTMILKWRDMILDGQLPHFDDVACGHWHVDASIPVGTRKLRIAGSPESHNVWAQERLSGAQRPSQRLMFVHPERGMVTNEYTVYLE